MACLLMENGLNDKTVIFPAWEMRFLQTLMRHFWFKFLGTGAFTSFFFLAYIYLLKNPSGTTYTMPKIWLDEWIGFQPLALLPYFSLWVYVSLPPIFMVRREDVIAYGWRVGLVCLSGLLCFYFWPNAVPPADIDWARYPGVAFLKGVDAAGNACPSLHVATAVFSGIWLHALLKRFGGPRFLRWLNAVWCVAIVWSTVATRQHVVLDAIAGVGLAVVGAWLSFLPGRCFPTLMDIPDLQASTKKK